MLWQTDGTPFEWLGVEYGRFALHAVIDDATGIVVGARFTKKECYEGYAESMKDGLRKFAIPMALYSDRHTIFRSPKEELTIEQKLVGMKKPLSDFGHAIAELGIEHIKAMTPQIKCRIERLWVTLQDRLSVELRLLGVKDIDTANKVLPKLIAEHNSRYSVKPADSDTTYVELGTSANLNYVFSRHDARKANSNSYISYKKTKYVPKDKNTVLPAQITVEVRETLNGDIIAWKDGHAVTLKKVSSDIREKTAKTDF